MRVLVTNDDGLGAVGLDLLVTCARRHFEEVVVVAPAREQSGVGMSISLDAPLRLVEHEEGRVVSVDGTPVDSVLVALGLVMRDQPPDLVLSGVNRGPNLGWDVHYSGTVAAARQAQIRGIPAVALSFASFDRFPVEVVEPVTDLVLSRVRAEGVPEGAVLNVNIPVPDDAAARAGASFCGVPGLRGMKPTTLGVRHYGSRLEARYDPLGRPYVWLAGTPPHMEDIEGSDCNAVGDGYVSVSPLGLDVTLRASLAQLARWHMEG